MVAATALRLLGSSRGYDCTHGHNSVCLTVTLHTFLATLIDLLPQNGSFKPLINLSPGTVSAHDRAAHGMKLFFPQKAVPPRGLQRF